MLTTCLSQLKTKKIKITPLRRTLLVLFHAADSPLSIPDLLKSLWTRGQKVNKTSVYRNLELLKKLKLIGKVNVSDRSQYYELSERTHHHHLVCLNCERIFDMELQETKLIETVEKISQKIKFSIVRHAMEFYGFCQKCQGEEWRKKVVTDGSSL